MIVYSFYKIDSGLFVGRTSWNDDRNPAEHARLLAVHIPEGCASIEGRHDPLSRRVDVATSKVVDYQPPSPGADFEWNAAAKRWALSAAAVARQDAARSADARLVEIEKLERPLLRRLALDPGDTAARTALAAIDKEIADLKESGHS